MSEFTVQDIQKMAISALSGQGLPSEQVLDIANEMVIAEYMGVKTHGLGKLISLNIGNLSVNPTILGSGPIFKVDGNRGNGFITYSNVADELINRTKDFGIALATVTNTTRYSSLFPYTSKVAQAGYISILMNTAGPAAVAPFGSIDPITGTNPLSFSFPSNGEAHSFDMATSDVVWGEIRQAALEGRRLKTGPFLNSAGDITSDPTEVNAVKVFGGAKGSTLNLAIEILAGILSGGRAGLECQDEYDCGALFISIDPEALGISLEGFSGQMERLLTEVRESRSESSEKIVRAPGDRGRSSVKIDLILNEQLDIPQTIITMLERMAQGENVSELASNPLFN